MENSKLTTAGGEESQQHQPQQQQDQQQPTSTTTATTKRNSQRPKQQKGEEEEEGQEMSGRLSPVMDVKYDLLNESPDGSPTAFGARRAAESAAAAAGAGSSNTPKNCDGPVVRRASLNGTPISDGGGDDDHHHHHHHHGKKAKHQQNVNDDDSDSHVNTDNVYARPPPAPAGGGTTPSSRRNFGTKQGGTPTSPAPHKGSPGAAVETATSLDSMDPSESHPHYNRAFPHGVPPPSSRFFHRPVHVENRASDVYESLNYDEVENKCLHEERERLEGHIDPAKWKLWLILALCGFLTGVVAFGIDRGQLALSKLKFKAVQHFLENVAVNNVTNNNNMTTTTTTTTATPPDFSGVSSPQGFIGAMIEAQHQQNRQYEPRSMVAAFFVFLGINLAYVCVAAAVVVFGEPVAKGSGIPEVKCYLNGVRIWRVVRLKTMFVKAVGILFAVASGLPVGKEGPMIHAGSAIASGVSAGKSSLLKWDTGFFNEFRSDAYKRAFITAGAAAGVGAAFGAPIGGLVFAVEEVCSFWNLELTVMVFLSAAVSPWTLQILSHPDGLRSGKVNGLIDFGLVTGSYNYHDIPFLMLLGITCGGLGAIFIHANLVITRWRKKNVDTRFKKFAEVVLVCFAVSMVLICLVLFGYNCVEIPGASNNTISKMKRNGCGNPEEFNDMATYFFQDLEVSINLLIHEPRAIPLGTLAKQFFPYFILTFVTYGINVPSGLFLPSLALGANFGHMFAQVMNLMIGDQFLDPAKFALYGGTGILAGNLRMTISVVAIVMEATGNATLFYPLAIITICSKFFGDLFNTGIFDEHIHLAKIPLLEGKNPAPAMCTMTAGQIMNKHPVRLPPLVTVRVLQHVLKHYPLHNVYMVCTEDDGTFVGMLLRRTALILIDKQAWKKELQHIDFARTEKERKYISVKKYGVLEQPAKEDMDETIDLLRYADLWPHVFPESTPVPRVYRTFRELGLRHIVVVDDRYRPVGLIGRRQLCFVEVTPLDMDPIGSAIIRGIPPSPGRDEGEGGGHQQQQQQPDFTTTGALPDEHDQSHALLAYREIENRPSDEVLLPIRDRDVRRSGLRHAPWMDQSLPES